MFGVYSCRRFKHVLAVKNYRQEKRQVNLLWSSKL
jgi:hypothetical protein